MTVTTSHGHTLHAADVSYVRDQVTSCESGFLNTTSKHDSLANMSRHSIYVRPAGSQGGFIVPKITPVE